MRVLITGAGGQVGTELKIQSDNYDFEMFFSDKNEIDISSEEDLFSKVSELKPDVIINVAAYTNVDLAEEERDLSLDINFIGVLNLSKVCKEFSILLIHLSTDYIFSGSKEGPYIETDAPDPVNTYGETKLLGERAIKEILSKYIIIRTSWLFSEHKGQNFYSTILKKIKEKEVIRVVDDQFGCPTSVKSLTNTIYLLCEKYAASKEIEYGIFHYVNYPPTSWHDFAQKISDLAYKKQIITQPQVIESVSYTEYATKATRPINSSLISKRLEESLGIKETSWFSELEKTIGRELNED